MKIMTLDLRKTHVNNPDCKMRIAQKPNGSWYCADCGFEIVWSWVEVSEVLEDGPTKANSEGGCEWPHYVDSPICVYDRDSFEKYQSGEYKVPTHCVCGAELIHEKPATVCLVEGGAMTGEMLLTLEMPLNNVQMRLLEEQDRSSVSMGCSVKTEPCELCEEEKVPGHGIPWVLDCSRCDHASSSVEGRSVTFKCDHPDAEKLYGLLWTWTENDGESGAISPPLDCPRRRVLNCSSCEHALAYEGGQRYRCGHPEIKDLPGAITYWDVSDSDVSPLRNCPLRRSS